MLEPTDCSIDKSPRNGLGNRDAPSNPSLNP